MNPLFLRDLADCCGVCGTYLRVSDNPYDDLQLCPFAPHDQATGLREAEVARDAAVRQLSDPRRVA